MREIACRRATATAAASHSSRLWAGCPTTSAGIANLTHFGRDEVSGRSWRDVARPRHLPRLPLPGGEHQPRRMAHMRSFAVNGSFGSPSFGSVARARIHQLRHQGRISSHPVAAWSGCTTIPHARGHRAQGSGTNLYRGVSQPSKPTVRSSGSDGATSPMRNAPPSRRGPIRPPSARRLRGPHPA